MTFEARVRVIAEGRVQGVGYREFARLQAVRRGVRGWTRNRSDGTVEAEMAGPEAAVEALLVELRRGPHHAEVTRLSVTPAPHIVTAAGFSILPTF